MLNGEIITLSNSQLVRSVLELRGRKFSPILLSEMESQRKNLQKRKTTEKTKAELSNLFEKIQDMLFIPEIISVRFSDKRHYSNILKRDGFFISGKKYKPFMASAGMLRRDSVLFIDADILDALSDKFENGRNKDIEIVPAKFSAYYSLYSSSSFEVTFPNIAIIPDCVFKSVKHVNYGTYVGKDIDPHIEEQDMELEFNAFDGQGLCSPRIARIWQRDLELDYLPSYFGIRAPFIKGQCTVFDFHEFGKKVADKTEIVDVYGDKINIEDVDCLVSESQFKLWQSYSNTNEYTAKCHANDLTWGITKVSPKADKNHARTSYQFLQVLNLDDDAIQRACQATLDWISFSGGGDVMSTIMYSLGETDFSEGWFDRTDVVTQAVIMDNSILDDGYVQQHYSKSLSKKMNDARMGRLVFEGNYQCMIADPYAQASHIFGMGIKPLLENKQHYSQYWNKKNISKVVAIRSPIVHHGEVNTLNLQNREDVNYWYRYIYSGIVYPANGIGMDAMIHGGSDFDLDIVCTINSPEILSGIMSDLPVVYDVKKPSKAKINSPTGQNVLLSQVSQIRSNKIGFYTNVSSTMYSLLANYSPESKEYKILIDRLRWGRVLQGTEIDKAKGVDVDPYPTHFTKYTKITDDMTEEEKATWTLNNSLLAERRPYFMRWLYSGYNTRYTNEQVMYDTISRTKWGIPFSEVQRCPSSPEQERLLDRYNKRTFFINNNSTMNRISRYVESEIKSLKQNWKKSEFNYKKLLSRYSASFSSEDMNKMRILHKEYKSLRKSLYDGGSGEISFEDNVEICKYINQKAYRTISSSSSELSDMAVILCYTVLGKTSKSFLWNVFGKELLDVIKKKHTEKYVRVPMYNDNGSLKYLWSSYGIYTIQIKES